MKEMVWGFLFGFSVGVVCTVIGFPFWTWQFWAILLPLTTARTLWVAGRLR